MHAMNIVEVALRDPAGLHPRADQFLTVAIRSRHRGIRVDELAQFLEPDQLVFEAGKAGIQSARIRQHEDARARNDIVLGPGAWRCEFAEEACIDAEPDECDDLGTDAADLSREDLLSRTISSGRSSAAERVARAQRLVSAIANSVSRRSCSQVSATGVRCDSNSRRQNGLPGLAK